MNRWNIGSFIEANNLLGGDLVILEGTGFGVTNRFLLYLGSDGGHQPIFAAKVNQGVRRLASTEARFILQNLKASRIQRFQGTKTERTKIANKVRQQLNEENFNLLVHWCLYGRPNQPKEVGSSTGEVLGGIALGALAIALLAALFSKDDE